jgi:hypothetical protein
LILDTGFQIPDKDPFAYHLTQASLIRLPASAIQYAVSGIRCRGANKIEVKRL